MAHVYVHRRADDGRVFYVGMGSRIDRSTVTKGRSKYWRAVAEKHGWVAEVVAHFDTVELAHGMERDLIAWYGRKQLANLTDGGEGSHGFVPSATTRAKLSALAARERTPAWVDSIRRARKGGGNGGVVKSGDKLPESWRAGIAAAMLGSRNHMHGRTGELHPRSRPVRCTETDLQYPSVTAAARSLGCTVGHLYNMLKGTNPNRTTLEFA